ncbi:TPM domain-containing protein [Planococcus shenhongbingii]|uniref:TPM domain-containing protein n=1 Tax=Planococcus shenhongbingii TaxID=3058398 RepID=A0ABT8NFW5_9BACL|nr:MULTISPECIES: TPM domain-containing protein [unclassified Planococcus (in: firmicutes)]MDN7246380.1 TPM domain-containing protein [Planococcus sp. N017]WKA59371.1 TPM domain-containing protein [Planococcus sp. N016]
MRLWNLKAPVLFLLMVFTILTGGLVVSAQTDQHVYDNAGLLSEADIRELETLAAEHSQKHGADFLFLTTSNMGGLPITTYMGDFFDQWAVENNQENAVLLTIDIGTRQVYLAGFGTAETSLDNQRVDMVLDRIMPFMRSGDYGGAFRETVTTASRYMEYRPGVNPENIFLKTWFQAAVSLLLGGVIVGSMVLNAGGRVTTTARTYFDGNNTRVRSQRDQFRNKTVSRRRIPKSNSGGGGFGGGGSTGGGRSFSGGGRNF